jgi:hypothetical protein
MAYETTTVAVEKSQADIRQLLRKHGAGRFEFGEATDDNGTTWAALGFAMNGRAIRMRVPLKPINDQAAANKARRARSKTLGEIRGEMIEQEAKRIWRVLAWNLKARLEAVEEGVETFEEAFLAHLLDERTGETVYEQLVRTGTVELGGPLLPELGAGS